MLDTETRDLMRDLSQKLTSATKNLDPYTIAILGEGDHDGAGERYDIAFRVDADQNIEVIKGDVSVTLSHYVATSLRKNMPAGFLRELSYEDLKKHHPDVAATSALAKRASQIETENKNMKAELTRLRALERSVVAATKDQIK